VVGAGSRGSAYAAYAASFPDRAKVVGVAEPRAAYREKFVQALGVPAENTVETWEELAARPKFADAVIIATRDTMHRAPAEAFAERGYHIMLEKPMAPSPEDCRAIEAAAVKSGRIFAVCHVLRYTAYTRKIKELVEAGAVGDVVSIQHLEPVGHAHQAHSFVRGNWRREDESSCMLLTKSCHDLDWLRHIMGVPCEAVHSFGSLKHFRAEERPEGAADRCLDCPVEKTCPYSAKRIYLDRAAKGAKGWPLDVLAAEVTEESIAEALRTGPYGRCVYACDNDVVDHQVVNMEFEGGRTASFTMTAFTKGDHRKTRIFGTRGELAGDGESIRIFDFVTETWRQIDTAEIDHSILGGHGGGDLGLMESFVTAVATEDPSRILSGPVESLETHLMVFAAERARHERRVVTMAEMVAQ
jgi:predicted dehydrogenase